MDLIVNYIALLAGLLISGSLWRLFASDPEVKVRAKIFSFIFLAFGVLCYTAQYYGGYGVK